jgi:hypothetical protein
MIATLLLGFGKNLFQGLRAVEIQHELHRACGFHSLRRAIIGDLHRGAIKVLGQECLDSLAGRAALVFTVKNGAISSQS